MAAAVIWAALLLAGCLGRMATEDVQRGNHETRGDPLGAVAEAVGVHAASLLRPDHPGCNGQPCDLLLNSNNIQRALLVTDAASSASPGDIARAIRAPYRDLAREGKHYPCPSIDTIDDLEWCWRSDEGYFLQIENICPAVRGWDVAVSVHLPVMEGGRHQSYEFLTRYSYRWDGVNWELVEVRPLSRAH
jgi:hypothetical protein